MNFPEELIKLPAKELKKELSDNIYKAKYVVIDKNIYEKKVDLNGVRYYNKCNKKDIQKYQIKDLEKYKKDKYIEPLSFELFNHLKAENIGNYLNSISGGKLYKYYLNKAINIFGKDYVYFDEEDGYYNIIIHFPSIKIRNSVEQELEMKDIYFEFTFYGNRVKRVSMARTTVSEVELRNGYIFSHLNHGSIGFYSGNFCMGDTEIAKVYDRIRYNSLACFRNIEAFFYMIEEYLSWESLEGVPYERIDNVLSDRNGFASVDCPQYSSTEMYKLIINNLDSFDYNYEISDGKYQIKLTNSTIDKIDEFLSKTVDEKYLFTRIDGVSKKLNFEKDYFFNKYNGNLSNVRFKGEYVENVVIKEKSDSIIESNKKVHTSILNHVVGNIQAKFNDYLINKKLKKRG